MRDLARRFPDEPYRRRMGAIAERLRRTRWFLTEEAGPIGGRYENPEQLVEELAELQASLISDGLTRVAYGEIQDFRWQVETFGFHLASLEIRQHADVHAEALNALMHSRGMTSPDLARELVPGVSPGEVLATFRAVAAIQRRFGEEACHRYVVSFTRTAADVLAVLQLADMAAGGDRADGGDRRLRARPGQPGHRAAVRVGRRADRLRRGPRGAARQPGLPAPPGVARQPPGSDARLLGLEQGVGLPGRRAGCSIAPRHASPKWPAATASS